VREYAEDSGVVSGAAAEVVVGASKRCRGEMCEKGCKK
jgi:hypothetical protein